MKMNKEQTKNFFEAIDKLPSPPPVSAEVVSQLFLYDNISPDFIPIKNLEEAKKYVEANYTEDDGIHPDFHSFPIYKKVGSVDADINGEDICTSITISSSSPSAPVVAEQERAEAERILKSKLDGKIMVANSPDFTFNKVIEAMVEFKHSPAERIEDKPFTDDEVNEADRDFYNNYGNPQ